MEVVRKESALGVEFVGVVLLGKKVRGFCKRLLVFFRLHMAS